MRRDGLGTNDNESFGVVFDTFHDRRNGFPFQISLAGGLTTATSLTSATQSRLEHRVDCADAADRRRVDGGDGHPVQVAAVSSGTNDWGINFKRVVKWKNENQHSRACRPRSDAVPSTSSSAATLVGTEPPQTHRNFELKPYGITGFTTDHPAGSLRPARGRTTSAAT